MEQPVSPVFGSIQSQVVYVQWFLHGKILAVVFDY